MCLGKEFSVSDSGNFSADTGDELYLIRMKN